MNRPPCGRGLFYHRDSRGQHETTPAEYVTWAQRRADDFGATFRGTPVQIEEMIRDGSSAQGDIFLDYGTSGKELSRNGLDAFLNEALGDPTVTHVFIPRRDRIARPDDPLDGVRIENAPRSVGITLVLMDRVFEPLPKGSRQDVAELITAIMDYDHAGRFRHELGQKMIHAQISLARRGFSTGGRPPYAFRRFLVQEDGTVIRELKEGETVRMAGHHVVWLPGPDEEMLCVRRILQMLRTTPASRVARTLTEEGIPSPDAGRWRTDNGIRHEVSGVWHATTVTNIARNPLLTACIRYGLRSMGDQIRFTPEGPRILNESDFREDGKPKVIRNSDTDFVQAPAHFDPVVDVKEHQSLIKLLDQRAGTQRGKPRSRDPNRNPLGGRIFDMTCTWPMYREPYRTSFRYKCGLYQQSHGQQCAHNHIDGQVATRFMMACIRQRIQGKSLRKNLEPRLRALADAECASTPAAEINQKEQELKRIESDLDRASRNLALAADDEQFRAVSKVFDKLKQEQKQLTEAISELRTKANSAGSVEREIETAFGLMDRLEELVELPENLPMARQLFDLVDARLFLRFRKERVKKRVLNRLQGGVATFGTAAPPINV